MDYDKVIEEFRILSRKNQDFLSEEITEIEEEVVDEKLKVAIVGEFSAGKSTFLNGILGKRILYSDNDESTMVVTEITNSEEKKATVTYNDGERRVINLENNDFKKKLKKVLINKDSKKVKNVLIEYPINLGKNIIFFDTPGLQGLKEEAKKATKRALREANLVIFIVNYKGLQGSEIEELQKEIKTENRVFIVNKIGALYGKYGDIKGRKKLDELTIDIKKRLSEENITNLKVLEVDSRDYLWGRDKELYKEVILNYDERKKKLYQEEKILSQEEYIERSNFKTVYAYFDEIFQKENRDKLKEMDFREKAEILLCEFRKYIRAKQLSEDQEKKNDIIEEEKNIILENRKGISNSLKREITNSYVALKDGYIDDMLTDKKQINELLVKRVDEGIREIKKINEETLEISRWLKKECDEQFKNYQEVYKKYIDVITENINRTYEEVAISKLKLRSTRAIRFTVQNSPINIEAKYDAYRFDEKLERLDGEIKCLEKEILILKKLDTSSQDKELKKLEIRIKKIQEERDRKIRMLNNNRPNPKQLYREETSGIWFWKKIITIPDGGDYTEINIWGNNKQSIEKSYEEKIKVMRRDEYALKKEKREINREKGREGRLTYLLKLKKDERKGIKEKEKKKEEEQKQIILERKKEEVYQVFKKRVEEYFQEFSEKFLNMLEDEEERVKELVEGKLGEYLEKIKEDLDKKQEELKEMAMVLDFNRDLEKLIEIKESIK